MRRSAIPFELCQRVLPLAWLSLGLLVQPAAAQPGQQEDPLSWDRNVRGLFSRFCVNCHKQDKESGGVNLAQDTDPRQILRHRETWETVQFVLADQSMPPEDARQPSEEERQWMLGFLERTLGEVSCEDLNDPGPPPLRRLNRVEYDHAIQDLTGLDLRIAAETFPPDVSSYGFDNASAALAMTPVQVEQYHDAARRIVAELIASKQDSPQSYQRIFGDSAPGNEQELRQKLGELSDRAFRRPASATWLDRLWELYQHSRSVGEDHETAMGHVVTAVLMAPQFLLRIEQNRLDEDEPYRVDDYELASRLSFFLWSRPPDDELLKLAAEGRLSDPEVLRGQMERLLADDRSQALVKHFFGQWLGVRDLSKHVVDRDVFPDFDDELRDSLQAEVEAFLSDLIREDRPLSVLLDSDYTYLNARLATHYGLSAENLHPEALQRVTLSDRRRGGVLTSGALLLIQSDPNRTNIPRRGNYIADRILGDPPPPPPPDVPELETVADGSEVPLRELFERHSASPACASCHVRIDPFGFALENYDALGRWRESDAGKPIDPSGKLKDGRELNGPVSLKDLLLEAQPAFMRSLAKQMIIYAMGRGLIDADRCLIDEIVSANGEQPLRFSELTWMIVSSRPFLYRRNPEF